MFYYTTYTMLSFSLPNLPKEADILFIAMSLKGRRHTEFHISKNDKAEP